MPSSVSSIVHTYRSRFLVRQPYFDQRPSDDLCLIITIPAYKEPDLVNTLTSLSDCIQPSGTVEIIIVVNAPDNAPSDVLKCNAKTIDQIQRWEQSDKPSFITCFVIREESIPEKIAGAGMARKIGMDEAAQRWAMIDKDGPIICLDADCTVSTNYLMEAEIAFKNPSTKVGHFHFEHDYEQERDEVLRTGIIQYELHLRCYIQGLKFAGYPFAVHTVGSCMAVRTSSYAKAGGMNKRKAGEDFYFLHKLVPLGGWKNITGGTVFPSCRASDRVPFGTGRAQLDSIKRQRPSLTYHTGVYTAMKPLFQSLQQSYEANIDLNIFNSPVRDFLIEQDAPKKITAMKSQSTTPETFFKRWWQWMDGFEVLRLTHYLRDHGFPNQPAFDVASALLNTSTRTPLETSEGALFLLRKFDLNQH